MHSNPPNPEAADDTFGPYSGSLEVQVFSALSNRPVSGARVEVFGEDAPSSPPAVFSTDGEGAGTIASLPAPAPAYSEAPSAEQPYSLFTVSVSAPGYETIVIQGVQILPGRESLVEVYLIPAANEQPTAESFVIGPNVLFGDYPPKIIEDEVKPVPDSGEIVLPGVVIPEYIVVHDGPPDDSAAQNYYVPYRDYIKNVASSEIYATWPKQTIIANVLAIQSFTLNRVYTEWYRARGYNFTITSSTAYDHKWIPERNIFDTISEAVDEVFLYYLSRPNVKQPILTQYCDGRKLSCPGIMSQWGSKALGDQGLDAIEILRNFYGASLYINEATQVSGVPSSYPGYVLAIGASGPEVRELQTQLAEIAEVYYSIPALAVDGIYGPATAASVSAFQEKFRLPVTGQVDQATWYKISAIYVAITKIAEYQ